MPSERSFEDLVECAFSIGGDAFDELHRLLYCYLLFFMGNHFDAEEIVQEALITVWQKWKTDVRNRGNLKSWVLQIAHHKAVDKLRQRYSHLSLELVDADSDEWPLYELLATSSPEDNPEDYLVQREDELEREETRLLIRKALDAVSPVCRSCLILRLMQGIKPYEVAKLHNRTVRQIERYVERGKEEFKAAHDRLQKERQHPEERRADDESETA
jgi:RNA polymerase sigma factor (sigma-70 family)